MVIFMPYYRHHGHGMHSSARAQPSTSLPVSNTQLHPSATFRMNRCRFISNVLCRIICSLFLLTIAVFLFHLSMDNVSNQREGSNIIAAILLTIAIVSFIRTCQKIRRYYTILHTRRRLIQRLRERQQAYDLAVALNSTEHVDAVPNFPTDLPSYKELFPSQPNLHSSSGTDPSSSLPPPSYNDFLENLVIHHAGASLPISLASSSTSAHPSGANRCLWITDQSRRPLCIRGSVTYV